ncbi:DUF1573 domain-containing protein [Barnesiella sp. WM24]|uniref:DUF1573 domain-containing protein n=1 Tax=Barnesiella sp. WM24 TaxID=2558278 RepID=UPI0010725E27|nr:DUF1573 domain-containing protein [Barnesiella sp. WM24]TFU93736.1 DUF1573 domain-containing protein [Barnesiella sp. WM24]
MKRHLLSIMTLFFTLAALAATPGIAFDSAVHDFGNVKEAAGPVSHDFVITNTGDAPLIIISATTSCGCTTPEIPKEPIKPGASAKMKVTFDPLGRPGEFEKNIKVKTNIKGKRPTLKLKGCVIPKNKK